MKLSSLILFQLGHLLGNGRLHQDVKEQRQQLCHRLVCLLPARVLLSVRHVLVCIAV